MSPLYIMSGVFSYHTFILPFIWNAEGSNKKSVDRFCDCFANNPNWVCTDFEQEHMLNTNVELLSDADAYLLYAEYQYFNPAARRAIYGFGAEIVHNYCFNPAAVRNKGRYIIEAKGETYTLITNAIRLRIYNTGVALFVLECENPRGGEYAHQNNKDAVKNINDYGRRICMPFLPNKANGYFTVCADKLTLSIDGVGDFFEDYMSFAHSINSTADIYGRVCLTHMCDFIKKLLGYGSDCVFSSNSNHAVDDKDVFYIYPAIDDRMFVACVVFDKELSEHYCKVAYSPNDETSKDLYELAFVDHKGGCSCMNDDMRSELLEKHVYRRWVGCSEGTVITVANQSLISVTDYEPTVNSFITQYYQLCCLCLAQRASIINFQREATTISQSIEKQGHSINTATITRILDLQERFVAFQSQLSFAEVTSQEQGIDLYNMIMESFYIEKERGELGSQLESLYAAANTNLDFTLNKVATVMAFVAFILSLASFCADLIADLAYFTGESTTKTLPKLTVIIAACAALAVTVAVIVCVLIKYRRRKR